MHPSDLLPPPPVPPFSRPVPRGGSQDTSPRSPRHPLSVTFQNDWNLHHLVSLHDIPDLLQSAFLLAEDKRFYRHAGVD
ncbi:hypothetical protein C2W62_31605 [Candidatus Entotheonella serta]|nr:hypothetical protein C2W62_31605 [Candidatus Entotheonella serta]